MAARIYPDAAYVQGQPMNGDATGVAAQAYMRALDQAQANAINGDVGGTWSPAALVTIAGAGMWCCASWLVGSSSTPCIVTNASTAPLTLGDGDNVVIAAGNSLASRTIMTSCGDGVDASGGASIVTYANYSLYANKYVGSSTSLPTGVVRIIVPLRVHDGATLSTAILSFIVSQTHSGVPQLPIFRVYKVDTSGNVTPLYSTGSIVGGYVTPATPGSGAAWYALGATQTLVLTCDAGVVIDRSRYTYFAEIVDEHGANAHAGNQYVAIACAFTSIPDLRPD